MTEKNAAQAAVECSCAGSVVWDEFREEPMVWVPTGEEHFLHEGGEVKAMAVERHPFVGERYRKCN